MPDRVERMIEDARKARDFLRSIGQPMHADAVQRLIVSRTAARTCNQQLAKENAALRAQEDRT